MADPCPRRRGRDTPRDDRRRRRIRRRRGTAARRGRRGRRTASYAIASTRPTPGRTRRLSTTGSIRVDTTGPSLDRRHAARPSRHLRSPRTATASATPSVSTASTSETGSIAVQVRDAADRTVRYLHGQRRGRRRRRRVGRQGRRWHGRPRRTYDVRLTREDAAGNTGVGVTRSVGVVALLGSVSTSKTLFFPQDLDNGLDGHPAVVHPGPAGQRSPGPSATRPGPSSRRSRDGDAMAAGAFGHACTTAGDATGSMLPTGRYTSYVDATDGDGHVRRQAVAFEMNAFKHPPSATTATRGRSITITGDLRRGAQSRRRVCTSRNPARRPGRSR